MPRRCPTNLASLSRGVLDWAERQGIERERLLRAASLDGRALDDSEARVPREAHVSLWRETGRLLSDPSFGLKSADAIVNVTSMGVVGMLAMTSSNVGESVERAVSYFRLLKEDVVARSYTSDDVFVIELSPRTAQPRALADASLAAFRNFMLAWTGEPVRVREVFFQHERPEDVSDYERVFPCRLHFGQSVNAIVFDREVRDIPLRTAQSDVHGFLEGLARAKLAEMEERDGRMPLPTAVAIALREAVAERDTRISTVARRLGMSVRTVQRGLAAHGLEYRRLVDDARWSIAGPLVATTELPLEEIAERLGYADVKAFRRAFRRWSGLSPGEARKRRGRSDSG